MVAFRHRLLGCVSNKKSRSALWLLTGVRFIRPLCAIRQTLLKTPLGHIWKEEAYSRRNQKCDDGRTDHVLPTKTAVSVDGASDGEARRQ
jgi:hypothetical protein